jgi:Family of unknown function (DUF6152)
MRTVRAVLLAGAGLLLAATTALAHHSFSAEYDTDHPVTLRGKVSKVVWKNPHVTFVLDVKSTEGKVTSWEVEMGSPNLLLSQGWTVSSIRAGDEVTVDGYRARNGAYIANAKKVTLAAR